MREILFRGKRVKDGEWVYGYLYKKWETCFIESEKKLDIVLPETVGEYTGLTDKNCNKIFEGDIVRLHYFYEALDPSTLGAYEAEEEIVAIISVWDMGLGFDQVGGSLCGYLSDWLESPQDELEVVGNKWDNPELLEVKK